MTIETAAGVEQSAHLKSMGHMGALIMRVAMRAVAKLKALGCMRWRIEEGPR